MEATTVRSRPVEGAAAEESPAPGAPQEPRLAAPAPVPASPMLAVSGASPGRAAPARSARQSIPVRGRVLLVDDDPAILRAFERILHQWSYETESFSDAPEALRAYEPGAFDVIISDIGMPSMDGLQLIRAIRQLDLDVPIILVTGEPKIESAIQAVTDGALAYLVKPVGLPALVESVERAIHMHQMAQVRREALRILGEANKELGDRVGLEVKFEAAIEGLYMAYQPIISWRARAIIGYEALVRSTSPELPHPGALFDAAERLQRVKSLNHAIRRLAPLPFRGRPDVGQLFFNLHVVDLDDDTLFDPSSVIASMADRVVLEVTERASLDHMSDIRSRVARLRDMGFKIAVDDIGAGYAGLSSFTLLEPEVVKFDMALVRDIHREPTKQRLVRSMNQLCCDMGMSVVAEGVESVAERDTLIELGCDLFQGFLFARPGPPFVPASLEET